jgi:hypothetical protein
VKEREECPKNKERTLRNLREGGRQTVGVESLVALVTEHELIVVA